MARYVILEHDWNGVHYDLMLEHGEALATWRLESFLRVGTQSVIRLPDHRMAYLEYEGKISGDRGGVQQLAAGQYEAALISDPCWIIELSGSIKGKVILRHVAEDRWQLEWPGIF